MLTRVLHARKILTWLSSLPEVDANRIGAYGISRGGYITWLLNAYDNRLKAVAPIYGCGGLLSPGRFYRYSRQAHTLDASVELERLLDGVKLAGQQQAPSLIMSGTNDYFGWMDDLCRAAAQIPQIGEHYTSLPTRIIISMSERERRCNCGWMFICGEKECRRFH